MNDWLWATAAELGRGIGRAEIDPVALTETYLDAIASHPMSPRIYARVTADRARSEAAAASARAKAGMRLGPLDGVPVSWKDLFDSADIGTEAGTALMQGRVPARDAAVLTNAGQAGLVCLGKTHMTEIAFSGLGYNPITATPPNINDPDVVPGGSSSGAAASVAFGLAAAAVGSDTGGSVRIPAAWNDLVGLKTTHGRLPLTGVVPLCETFDTVGPLCRSVEDAALMLAALEGSRAADLALAQIEGARLMILGTVGMDDLRDAPRDGFADAVARLSASGAMVEQVEIPRLGRAFELAGALFTADAWSWWSDKIEADPEKMFFQIYQRIRAGAEVGAAEYLRAWRELKEIRADYAAATAGYDAVILPTSPIPPPNLGRLIEDEAYFRSENLLALRNTRVANLMGSCAVTLPTSVPSAGIMFNSAPGCEAALLRLCSAAAVALA